MKSIWRVSFKFKIISFKFTEKFLSIASGGYFYVINNISGKESYKYKIPVNCIDISINSNAELLLLLKHKSGDQFLSKINIKTGKRIFIKRLKFSIFNSLIILEKAIILKSPGFSRLFLKNAGRGKRVFNLNYDNIAFKKQFIRYTRRGYIFIFSFLYRRVFFMYKYLGMNKNFFLYKGGLITLSPF